MLAKYFPQYVLSCALQVSIFSAELSYISLCYWGSYRMLVASCEYDKYDSLLVMTFKNLDHSS